MNKEQTIDVINDALNYLEDGISRGEVIESDKSEAFKNIRIAKDFIIKYLGEPHNGWTNYATWRINLDFVDGMDWEDDGGRYDSVIQVADGLKERCEEYMDESTDDTNVLSWASAFVSDVNWIEIAKNVIENYPNIMAKKN